MVAACASAAAGEATDPPGAPAHEHLRASPAAADCCSRTAVPPDGGPLEEVPGGFDSWPPSPAPSGEKTGTVHELRLVHSAKK